MIGLGHRFGPPLGRKATTAECVHRLALGLRTGALRQPPQKSPALAGDWAAGRDYSSNKAGGCGIT